VHPRSAPEWEALLYDWHNDHRLRDQRKDIGYWLESIGGANRLLVLGAGTGRVAVPLARHQSRTTAALDLSLARLRRMPSVPGLVPICGDLRSLPINGPFDAAVAPYSTLQLLLSAQDRESALAEAARALTPGAHLYIDVSGNFDTRSPADWHITLREPCPAVGATVQEWERSVPMTDHVLIEKSFRVDDGTVLAEVRERWAYLDSLDLAGALDRAGFDVTGVDHGYGADNSPHRVIYHARRRA